MLDASLEAASRLAMILASRLLFELSLVYLSSAYLTTAMEEESDEDLLEEAVIAFPFNPGDALTLLITLTLSAVGCPAAIG